MRHYILNKQKKPKYKKFLIFIKNYKNNFKHKNLILVFMNCQMNKIKKIGQFVYLRN